MAIKIKAPRLCIVCGERPAAVPDRNDGASARRKKVCRECHTQRLVGDMKLVIRAQCEKENAK